MVFSCFQSLTACLQTHHSTPMTGDGEYFPQTQAVGGWGAGRSHTSIYWNSHSTFSKWQLAQWHLLQNLILSKGTFSCWRVTQVQVSSLWRRRMLYVTGALSPLPTWCQRWWHHPQQEWLQPGEFTPAIVRDLPVIRLRNCFPRCTTNIKNA